MIFLREKLKALRLAKKIRQSALAKDTGTTQGDISAWENGTRNPCFENVSLLSKYFNISPLDFYKEEQEEPQMIIPVFRGSDEMQKQLDRIERKLDAINADKPIESAKKFSDRQFQPIKPYPYVDGRGFKD